MDEGNPCASPVSGPTNVPPLVGRLPRCMRGRHRFLLGARIGVFRAKPLGEPGVGVRWDYES
jgi:hypothetical protein